MLENGFGIAGNIDKHFLTRATVHASSKHLPRAFTHAEIKVVEIDEVRKRDERTY